MNNLKEALRLAEEWESVLVRKINRVLHDEDMYYAVSKESADLLVNVSKTYELVADFTVKGEC